MRKYLIRCVLLVVGICFSISASELNAFGIHNTFFDQYDSYVKSNDLELQADTKTEKDKGSGKSGCIYPVLFARPTVSKKWVSKIFYSPFLRSSTTKDYFTKIFLRNSVWRI